jgi:hypothetical protein
VIAYRRFALSTRFSENILSEARLFILQFKFADLGV